MKKNKFYIEMVIILALLIIVSVGGIIFLRLNPKEKNIEKDDKNYAITKMEEFIIDMDKEYVLSFNDKEIKISPSATDKVITKINDVTIKDFYAMGGYLFDDFFALYSVSQNGKDIKFFDKNLQEIKLSIDNYLDKYYFEEIYLSKEVIKVRVVNKNYEPMEECRIIDKYTICPCETFSGDKINIIESFIQKIKDDALYYEFDLVYDGNTINSQITGKKTIWNVYGEDILNNSGIYCVKTA